MFKFSETATYFMPAHFGGHEGPTPAVTYHDMTSIMVSYETDPGLLAQYIPEAFQLTQPVVTIQYGMCRAVDWLAGGAYNLITVGVPVACAQDREHLEGLYVLVIWENKTAPILNGREQSGMPKIFADIEDHHQLGDRVFTNASYEGSAFLRMDFRKTKPLGPEELTVLNQQSGKVNAFGWRYIPNTGRPGAALSHATLYPQELPSTEAWLGEGRFQWEAPTPEQHPTQAHIIQALSQLPIKAYRDCMMTHGSVVLRNDLARQLP
jgi:acetoacetate decarboxylase